MTAAGRRSPTLLTGTPLGSHAVDGVTVTFPSGETTATPSSVLKGGSSGAPPPQATGCVGKADDDSGPACSTDLTWDNWGQGFVATNCTACHSADAADRHDAPEDLNFDTEAEVRAAKDDILRAVVQDQTEPLGGGLTAEDRANLEEWLTCGG